MSKESFMLNNASSCVENSRLKGKHFIFIYDAIFGLILRRMVHVEVIQRYFTATRSDNASRKGQSFTLR